MKSFIRLLKDSATHFGRHNASRMGAALSYYAVFSIAPLAILVIALVGSIFGTQLAESSIVTQLDRVIGSGAGDFVASVISSTAKQSLGSVGALVSIATIIFGSVSVLSVLDIALDELWETKEAADRTKRSFFARIWKSVQRKFPAFSIIPVIALLFLFFVATSVFLSLYQDQFGAIYGFGTAVKFIEPVALFVFGTAFFAFIYRVLPDRALSMKAVLIGGMVTSLLFLIGRLVIGYYIASFAKTSLYGAAGSLVAMLIWIYYSAQVFFYGASFTYVYAKRHK